MEESEINKRVKMFMEKFMADAITAAKAGVLKHMAGGRSSGGNAK